MGLVIGAVANAVANNSVNVTTTGCGEPVSPWAGVAIGLLLSALVISFLWVSFGED